jgi:nucleoside-diphosphate-sugar epimerase
MNSQKVLVTGATGFVGCRLAEVLTARDIEVVGLVRSWHKAARLARLPVRLMHGSLLDKASLREAMRDCDVVFHCAMDSSIGGPAHRQAMVDGTANVMEAAIDENVKRVVYLSSTAVYGFWPTQPRVTEETPVSHTGDAYCDGKIDSEKVALAYHRDRGLPIVVLRPSMVYGPYETFWARHLITCLQRNWMPLINGGHGICNSLYIDNLIEAMWLAAGHDNLSGHVFIISDAEPVTWKQMIEGHATAIRGARLPLPDNTEEEIAKARKAEWRSHHPSSARAVVRLLRRPEARQALRKVPAIAKAEKVAKGIIRRLPVNLSRMVKPPPSSTNGASAPFSQVPSAVAIPLSEDDVRFYSCQIVFSIEKARKMLGYSPTISFDEGMRRTAEWLQWMRW